MSTQTYLRATAITALGTLTFVATATAANAGQSRYNTHYDFERGPNCGSTCSATMPTSTRYGSGPVHTAPAYVPPAPIASGPVYVDCTQIGTCAPAVGMVQTQTLPANGQIRIPDTYIESYQAPAPSYSTQSYSSSTLPAECPSGTTMQSDGTCMQSSSYSSGSTYTGSTSYSSGTSSSTTYGGTTSYGTTSSSSFGGTADCPSGTTMQSDGTCMQMGSSSYSSSTTYSAPTTSYTAPTTSYGSSTSYSSGSSMTVNCPAGTVSQGDGTCMQSGSASVEIYSGGYQSGSIYGSTDYRPIRK